MNDGINTLTSTVNGLSGSDVIINTNVLGLAGTDLTSTVNGVISNILDLSSLQGVTSINTTAIGPNVDIVGDTDEITVNTIGNTVNIGLATNPIVPGVTPCSAGKRAPSPLPMDQQVLSLPIPLISAGTTLLICLESIPPSLNQARLWCDWWRQNLPLQHWRCR